MCRLRLGCYRSVQQATMDFKNTVDQETLSVSLNINVSSEAEGGFDDITASAKSTLDLDALYRTASKDQIIVAHASVVNGSTFITSQKKPIKNVEGAAVSPASSYSLEGVRLTDSALNILNGKTPNEDFRTACGDGFVASIATGADLYLIYHFTHLENEVKTKLKTSMEVGGGMTGVFRAKGNFGTEINFDDLVQHDNLGIFLLQSGGKTGALPTDLASVSTKVSNLTIEAAAGGRPLYLVVIPYSVLSNWPLYFSPDSGTKLRMALVRYLIRMTSVFQEMQTIIADSEVHTAEPDSADYLHDAAHGLRATDYALLSDDIRFETKKAEGELRDFDTFCHLASNQGQSSECDKVLDEMRGQNIDDFRFWIRLPAPRNAFTTEEQKLVLDRNGDIDDRKFVLETVLYRHWIERLDNQRCAVFDECMSSLDRIQQFSNISSLLFP